MNADETETDGVVCPGCGRKLGGLGTFCWNCEDYVAALAGEEDEDPEPAVPEPSEEEIRHGISEHARALGYAVVDTEQGWRPGPGHSRVTPGLSDLIVLGDGRLAFAEVKRPGRSLTDAQDAFRSAVVRAGADFQVWTSLSDFFEWHGETS